MLEAKTKEQREHVESIVKKRINHLQDCCILAGKELASANMRLEGTRYENDMRKVIAALSELNNRLINDINK